MAVKWIKTNSPGVRYREHPTRRNGVQRDRYFSIRYKVDGKDREEALGWASQGWTVQKAVEKLSEIKHNLRVGQGPQSLSEKRSIEQARRVEEQAIAQAEARQSVTVESFFQLHFLPHIMTTKKKGSRDAERFTYQKWIAPEIGHIPMRDLVPFHVEKFKKRMNTAGKSARTIQLALSIVRQMWALGKRDGIVQGESPTLQVKRPTADNRRLRFLTHEEADTLLAAIQVRSHQLYEMSILALHCGLRAGEIFALTWGDVDLVRGLLILRDTKNGKSRSAIMTGAVRALLAGKLRGMPSDLVFPGRNGQRIRFVSSSFDRIVQSVGLNDGVKDARMRVVFHTMRHTYASWLVEEGIDLYTVKTLLGHASIKTSERYAHLGQNLLHNAVRKLEHGILTKQATRDIHLTHEIKHEAI